MLPRPREATGALTLALLLSVTPLTAAGCSAPGDGGSGAATEVEPGDSETGGAGGEEGSTSASTTEQASEPGFLELCEPGSSPTLTLGGGLYSYEPWAGGEAVLVYGHQGGYHIDVSLLATRLSREGAASGTLRGYIDGELLAVTPFGGELSCRIAGDGLELAGNILIWDAEPAALHGELARVEASLTDGAGTTVEASAEVVIIDPFAP